MKDQRTDPDVLTRREENRLWFWRFITTEATDEQCEQMLASLRELIARCEAEEQQQRPQP